MLERVGGEVAAVETQRGKRGAGRDALLTATARLLGFATTSNALRERLAQALDALIAKGTIIEQNNLMTRTETKGGGESSPVV